MLNRRSLAHAASCTIALAMLAGCGGKDDIVAQAAKQDEARGVPAPGLAETSVLPPGQGTWQPPAIVPDA